MRKILAFVGLLCGAASADAAESTRKWCSSGFDKPAEIILNPGDPNHFVVTIGGKPQNFLLADIPSFNSLWFVNLISYNYETDGEPEKEDEQEVIVFRDRVFWPCN